MYTETYVRESQPDWLTVGGHTKRSVADLTDLAARIRDTELSDANRERPWALLGYQGYRCGRIRFGTARGWALVQLSGDLAAAYLDEAVDAADSVSRLDLAVTLETDHRDTEVGKRVYDQALAWRTTHPKAASPWFIGGADSGWTTYIGKRDSDLFFRCYDKQAESEDEGDFELARQYKNAWRFELEVKGRPAEETARRLLCSADIPGTCSGLVHAYLDARGVCPPWTPEQPIRSIGTLRRRSDRDRKLAWLSAQVRPTVAWLVENGGPQAVIAALGLAENSSEDSA